MQKGYYSRTDITKKVINELKTKLTKMKEANPNMTWQERNEVMNITLKQYEGNELIQIILVGDSICKWWNKKYK